MNKIYVLFFIFFFSCNKNTENLLITNLTNDSISMWDVTMKNLIKSDDTTYYHHYFRNYVFQKDYVCNAYGKTSIGKRIPLSLGPINYKGTCNKWEIFNDSTIKLNCEDVFVVRIISRDTVHLIDTLGVKQHEMYRVQPPWNIDEESVRIRDNKVESGEYLDKKIY